MKAYTDIEQGKKLAEILPVDSADMCYRPYREEGGIPDYQATLCPYHFASWIGIPCWSLAALLEILSDRASSIDEDANVILSSYKTVEWWDLSICNSVIEPVTKSDPIDACVEMIVKLKEKELL